MNLIRYSIGTLLIGVLTFSFVYVYLGITGSLKVEFFSISINNILIALWVLVPVFVLYLASIAHMSYFSLRSFSA